MFYFGVDYYPEHWPEERWPEDARLMAEAGFNVVRLAEFAWSRMEPKQGQYDFDWLDRAIDILTSHDIRVVLGTPTASPPPWLMARHPDSFRVREDGQRVTFGNRREYCPNNLVYREYTHRIVTRMAEHYADHPAVIGWQIDNEFGDRCYCPVCARAFQDWLRRRYGSLDELNEKWGTIFWSHVYTDWDQIPLPLETGGSPNPGLALDFFRFSSDSYVAYQQMQVDILREKCPEHFVTHNFHGFHYEGLNYFDLARDLDFVAWDNYQRTGWLLQAQVDPSYAALAHDAMRGLKRQNFWVMEQQAGQGGWEMVSVAPRPGELRLWAYQAIAHGADAVLFFRWRTARFGTEQYWHGLLDHDGHAGRRYQEIKRMGAEIKTIGERLVGSSVKPSVAMILSYDSRFAFQIQANNPGFSYPNHFHQVYRALHRRHVLVDVVAPTADLSSYQLVVAPALHVLPDAVAGNLKRFVAAGGVLVVTPRSGVKDEANAVVNQRLPGLLAELCGVEVEEYDSLGADMYNEVEFTLPELASHSPVAAKVWCDVLQPHGTTAIARYTQDYYAGKPAITLNRFGQGQVVYVGTVGDARLYEALVGWLLNLAGVQEILAVPRGVEVTERWQGDRLLFVLNHAEREQEVTLDGRYVDLLDGSAVLEGRAAVAPRDVLILLDEENAND
ncbi:MAG: beta-galactosidase [Chloroflexi bacterium]|nr:beta-galactosidase [Chloroflexota bacterium]